MRWWRFEIRAVIEPGEQPRRTSTFVMLCSEAAAQLVLLTFAPEPGTTQHIVASYAGGP